MPITAADIKFYLSGGAANSDPDASLGGAVSTTEVVTATLHNLFDVVSGDEAAAGDAEYRCIYVKNTHGTLTLQNAAVYVQSETSNADSDELIGLGTSAIDGTEQTVADESSAPAGVTFSQANGAGAALAIGDLGPGQTKAIWIRRDIVAAAAAANNDSFTLRVTGETAA
jgi:hypothetical protein